MPDENDIRAAFRTLAASAPDTSAVLAAVPTWQPPVTGVDYGNSPRRPRRPRWPRFAAPLAAAAAVAAVIATSVAIAGGGHQQRPASASGSVLERVPRYYLALTNSPKLNTGVVRDTVTGATVATIHAPGHLRFYEVFAAADDRTFVLLAGPPVKPGVPASRQTGTFSFFVGRLNPARGVVTLSLLPDLGPAIPSSADMFALSPDGARLAVGLGVHSAQLRIYSLAGHLVKEWQEKAVATYPFVFMSWGGGTLAYGLDGSTIPSIWTLNTNAASGSLLRASRLAVSYKRIGDFGSFPVVSGDGKTIVVGLSRYLNLPPRAVRAEFAEYSAATGKLIRYLWPTVHDMESVVWSNFSGSALVVLAPVHRYSPTATRLGVLSGGRFVPIPDSPTWANEIAF